MEAVSAARAEVRRGCPPDALVVSLNFHPGHFSHLVANYRLFAEAGFDPCLYVNEAFNGMDADGSLRKINRPAELGGLRDVRVAVFWFPSLRNALEMARLRLRYRTKNVYVYHEPLDSIVAYYKSGFRFLKIAKILLTTLVNLPVLLLAHGVILPSAGALRLYRRKFAWLNSNYRCIPLLFDDEARPEQARRRERDCVSYIGTIAADHAFDRFVEFVDAAVSGGWLPGCRFLIATKSRVPARERTILESHAHTGRVEIFEGRPMRTPEINGHFERSLVVWNAYHRSMQSGVLPKAYMFGAPVISLRRNANEFVEDGVTGVLVDRNDDPAGIRAAVEEVRRGADRFSRNCRDKFLATFYYRGAVGEFRELLDLDGPEECANG